MMIGIPRNSVLMLLLAMIALIIATVATRAETFKTPGAIAELGTLPDAAIHYDGKTDAVIYRKGQQSLITVGVLPSTNIAAALKAAVDAYDALQFAHNSYEEELAGMKAASVELNVYGASIWGAVVDAGELNLLITVRDTKNARALKKDVEVLLKGLRFPPGRHPPELAGVFELQSRFGAAHDVEAPNRFGSIDTVDVRNDGSFLFIRRPFAVGGLTIRDGVTPDRGQWEVRGNRLLSFIPPITFTNYRLDLSGQDPMLYANQGEQIRLIRRNE